MEKADGYAKFWLQPDVELDWSRKLRGKQLNRLQAVLEERQEWFLEQWNEYLEIED